MQKPGTQILHISLLVPLIQAREPLHTTGADFTGPHASDSGIQFSRSILL